MGSVPAPDNPRMSVRVLVAEDDPFTRMLLNGQLINVGFTVVGLAESVNAALRCAKDTPFDVGLLDLDLGRGPTGIDLAYALRDTNPTVGIVLLTTYADSRLIGDRRPLPDGAAVIVKRTLQSEDDLRDIVLQVARSPLKQTSAARGEAPRLSDGQVEILRLVAHGFSNAEIARRRQLTEAAVVKALGRLQRQLGIEAGSGDNPRVLLTQAYFRLTGAAGDRRD
jgi:DNA-binding NarL/FixJ family response regulator